MEVEDLEVVRMRMDSRGYKIVGRRGIEERSKGIERV